MTVGAWASQIRFSDGTLVSTGRDDVIVLVGPNNSGKSVALKNISELLRQPGSSGLVITNVETSCEGSDDELERWFRQTCRRTSQGKRTVYSGLGVSVEWDSAKQLWAKAGRGLHALTDLFCCRVTAEERLTAANPAQAVALTTEPYTHPIHYLQADDALEERISERFERAFGLQLVVHRNAGNQVPLYCGKRPAIEAGEDRVSLSYLKRLEALPTLHSQGDGMRSFVGVLLHSAVAKHSIVLVDEPEAFLHPPQARLLGRMLVQDKPAKRQLFVATHSVDVLRGLLDAESHHLRVLRIRRHKDVNHVTELSNDDVRELWSDPLLRHSGVLEGVFHEKVVVCEGDADCRFYSAVFDSLASHEQWRSAQVLFTHCGGKARMPVVIRALRRLDVPVMAIADFDVLNSARPLRPILEALGLEWSRVEGDWRQVKAAVDTKKPSLNSEEVRKEIEGILAGVSEQFFPRASSRDIQQVLRRSSPWATAKSVGAAFIPSGQPTHAYQTLMEECRRIGFFVVPVGEVEGFARSVGGHGPKWVNEVVKRNLSLDDELSEARHFVQQVLDLSPTVGQL